MVLNRAFVNDSRKDSTSSLFKSPRRQSFGLIWQCYLEDGLKMIFCSGQESDLHVHCSGLMANRALSQYDNFTQKITMKRTFVSYTREETLHIHCLVSVEVSLSGVIDRTSSWYDSFTWKMFLKWCSTWLWYCRKRLNHCYFGLLGQGSSKLVELHLEDGLEMAGHTAITPR